MMEAPLNWLLIKHQIILIMKRKIRKRLVTVREITDAIHEEPGKYRELSRKVSRTGRASPEAVASDRAMLNRVNTGIGSLGWEPWSDGRATNKAGRVFICPFIKEDPAVARARKEVQTEAKP